ncbi:MAG: FAD-dependent oxidoreductase [Bauldia sp.]|nr:FAD-dependent oxidoreductase [Bauldia sp.]
MAGLSAAHELKERGFAVTIYERNTVPGGKARSFPARGAPRDLHTGFPTEHGFRFFPGFYIHLDDTLSRIPTAEGSLLDNLVTVKKGSFVLQGQPFFDFPTQGPTTLRGWIDGLERLLKKGALGLTREEAAFAALKLGQAMSMCRERRHAELEGISYWDYMHGDDFSDQYRTVVLNGLTQSLVAMSPKDSSTSTIVTVLARFLAVFMTPGGEMDRVLDGPTSDVWIEPWVDFLKAKAPGQIPVVFHYQQVATRFDYDAATNKITRIHFKSPEGKDGAFIQRTVDIDPETPVLAAVPVESMNDILAEPKPNPLLDHAPSLKRLASGTLQTAWMSGLTQYLLDDETMDTGHVVYLNSSWAVTSISPNQFWRTKVEDMFPEKPYRIGGIVSAIISDTDTPSPRTNRTARESNSPPEVWQESMDQIKDHVTGEVLENLQPHNLRGAALDPALRFKDPSLSPIAGRPLGGRMSAFDFSNAKRNLVDHADDEAVQRLMDADELTPAAYYIEKNLEPLFINTINSWKDRPEPKTEVDNLFLAADYVRNQTDLALMEGANEAARRAVNGILKAAGMKQDCALFEFEEPKIFAPFRAIDRWLFDRHLPHPGSQDLFEIDKIVSATGAGVAWNAARVLRRVRKLWRRLSDPEPQTINPKNEVKP